MLTREPPSGPADGDQKLIGRPINGAPSGLQTITKRPPRTEYASV